MTLVVHFRMIKGKLKMTWDSKWTLKVTSRQIKDDLRLKMNIKDELKAKLIKDVLRLKMDIKGEPKVN